MPSGAPEQSGVSPFITVTDGPAAAATNPKPLAAADSVPLKRGLLSRVGDCSGSKNGELRVRTLSVRGGAEGPLRFPTGVTWKAIRT